MRARAMRLMTLTLALGALGEGAFAAPTSFQTVEIVAEGMCCQGCARKVAGKLYTARGVRSVDTDVPTHAVKVQAPQAGVAYLGTLWDAVAAGDGAPTSLVTADATFKLKPAAEPGTQQITTAIRLAGVATPERVRRVADRFGAVEGVTGVRFDQTASTLLVTTAPDRRLNPWAAVELAAGVGERPVSVVGPAGVLTIQWNESVQGRPRSANQSYPGGTTR